MRDTKSLIGAVFDEQTRTRGTVMGNVGDRLPGAPGSLDTNAVGPAVHKQGKSPNLNEEPRHTPDQIKIRLPFRSPHPTRTPQEVGPNGRRPETTRVFPRPGSTYIPRRVYIAICVPLGLLADPRISPLGKLVFGRLALHFNPRTRQCNPRIEQLAAELGVSTDSITRCTNELLRAGLIRRIRSGRGRANHYEFVWQRGLETGHFNAGESPDQTSDSISGAAELLHRSPDDVADPPDHNGLGTADLRPPETADLRRANKEGKDSFEIDSSSPWAAKRADEPEEEEEEENGVLAELMCRWIMHENWESGDVPSPSRLDLQAVRSSAPGWTDDEIVWALERNRFSHPAHPRAFSWFRTTTANIYTGRNGRPPVVAAPNASSSDFAKSVVPLKIDADLQRQPDRRKDNTPVFARQQATWFEIMDRVTTDIRASMLGTQTESFGARFAIADEATRDEILRTLMSETISTRG